MATTTENINVEKFLTEIVKIFGLSPNEEPDHKVALKEVEDAVKKYFASS